MHRAQIAAVAASLARWAKSGLFSGHRVAYAENLIDGDRSVRQESAASVHTKNTPQGTHTQKKTGKRVMAD